MSIEEEVDKNVKLLVNNIPEKIRQEINDRLLVAFGVRKLCDFPYLKAKSLKTLPNGQRKGQRWNKVVDFYH